MRQRSEIELHLYVLNNFPDTTTRLCYDDRGYKDVKQCKLALYTVGLGKDNERVLIDVPSV